MSNTYFDVDLTIGSTSSDLTWAYPGIPSAEEDRDPLVLTFDQGTHNGGSTVYTHVRVSIHRGVWRDCGSSGNGDSNDRIYALPAEGQGSWQAFCVHADTKKRGRWHDPKIKIINKDGTGQYADPGSAPGCTC